MSIPDLSPEQKSNRPEWRCYSLKAPDSETAGAWCLEHGASGTVIDSPDSLRAYLLSDPHAALNFCSAATEAGFQIISSISVEERNWVQECHDVWQPLTVGALNIIPFLSTEQAPPTAPQADELRIVPGFGFGTGHHATTAMIIEMLQDPALVPPPTRPSHETTGFDALDLGTGSGLLALAIHKLFRMRVLGVDIDFEALKNAKENLGINHCVYSIPLVCGDIASISGPFPLVAANLYAAILETIAEDLAALVAPEGLLLLSGMYLSEAQRIRSLYSRCGLVLVSERHSGEWAALCFKGPKVIRANIEEPK